MTSYIKEYWKCIENGYIDIDGKRVPLLVGWKVRKAYEKIMSYFDNPNIVFNCEYAHKKINFEETCCLQRMKPYHNVPIKLMLWQKAYWEAIYSFYDLNGIRLINRSLLMVGRKNGKSTMYASDINDDLFRGESGVRICCASNEDKTAKFIWNEVASMKKKLDPKDEVTSKTLTEIRNDLEDITIVRMSGKAVNDGDNFAKVAQDEVWDCKTDELPEACERSMSTNEERLFAMVTTQGFINDGYLDHELTYANAWLNDEIDDLHYLPVLYEQDDEKEVWGDINILQKANPSLIYGVKKFAFLEQSRRKAMVSKESRIHFLTKDCNIKVSNSAVWLTPEEYDYTQEQFTLEEFRGCVALGGVDLSDCGDLTIGAILLMKKDSDVKYIVVQAFIPESKLDDKDNGADYRNWSSTINPQTNMPYVEVIKGNRINQKNVADWFQKLRYRFQIETIMIGYDRWHSDVFIMWCDKKTGYNFNTMKIYQNSKMMSMPMKTLERDIQARLVNHGNNPVVKSCFANMSSKIVDGMIMPEKINGQYSRKIDAVVTIIILYATLEKNEMTFEQYLK